MPKLHAVHPVLMASDVTASVAFFRRLGFALVFTDDPAAPSYAAVRRDDVELHLQWHDHAGYAPDADRPVYRFPVDDVDGLFAEFRQAGVLPADTSVQDTPWGTREVHLHDPDRHGLQFYQPRVR